MTHNARISSSEGSLARLFLRYLIPAIAAIFLTGLHTVVNGIFVGHYVGQAGLAGYAMAWPWLTLIFGTGILVGVGIASLASLARGANDPNEAAAYIGQTLVWLLVPGLVIGSCLYVAAPAILRMQGGQGEVIVMGTQYLRMMAMGAPVLMSTIIVPFLLRNLDAPYLATLCAALAALTNICLDYLFVVHLGWGMGGVATATVLAQTVSIAIGLWYMLGARNPVPLKWADAIPNGAKGKKIFLNGLSSLFMYSYFGTMVVFHNVRLLEYGSAINVASYAVAGYVTGTYYLFAEGVGHGMQPVVSQLWGAGRYAAARKVLIMAMAFGVGTGVLLVLILQTVPGTFARFFVGDNPALVAAASQAYRLNLSAVYLDGLFAIAASFFQAVGKGRRALVVTIGNIVIQVPFLALLPFAWGLTGVWLAVPVSNLLLSPVVIFLLWKTASETQVTTLNDKAAAA